MEPTSCPFCEQEVTNKTKKCPHCHEWLRPGNWNPRNPTYQTYYIIVALLMIYIGASIYEKELNPRVKKTSQTFVPGKTKLAIKSSKLVQNGRRIIVTGEIQNVDTVTWNNIYLRAQYFDKSGTQIDEALDIVQISSGETKPFFAEFSNYDKSNPKLYDHYKTEITSASNY